MAPSADTGNGILGFIGGFVKVFFIIVAIILIIALIGFILYRMSRKDDNIGFQDFLIDSVFHSRERPDPVVSTPVSSTVIVPPTSVATPIVDPLTSYTPPAPIDPVIPMTPVTPVYEPTPMAITTDPLADSLNTVNTPSLQTTEAPTAEHIPDWLKVPSNEEKVETQEIKDTTSTDNINTETEMIRKDEVIQDVVPPTDVVSPTPEVSTTQIPQSSNISNTSNDESAIPDWIKDAQSTPADSSVAAVEDTEVLPDWLMSSITKENTENEERVETEKIGDNIGIEGTETIDGNTTPSIIEDSNLLTLQTSSTPDTPVKAKKSPRKPKAKSEEEKKESIKAIPAATNQSETLPSWLQ